MRYYGVAGENILAGQVIGCLPGTLIYTRVAVARQSKYLHNLAVATSDVHEGALVCGESSMRCMVSGELVSVPPGVQIFPIPDELLASPGMLYFNPRQNKP